MPIRRLQSPFEHWLSGLIAEVATFAAFIFAMFLISVLVSLAL